MVLEQCHRLNNGSLSCPQTCEDLDPTEGDCERCVYHPVHSLIEKKTDCRGNIITFHCGPQELKANACIGPSAGNVWGQGRIGSFSTPNGLKMWRKFSDLPQSEEKTEIKLLCQS